DKSMVPGKVINHSPASSRKYIGSPGIVIMDEGKYLVSHDFFGPGSECKNTFIYKSENYGKSWTQIALLSGQWWSNLFEWKGNIYIFGTDKKDGKIVIRRSEDAGETWTIPENLNKGILTEKEGFHCAPMPVANYQGRLWRAFEKRTGKETFSFVMSAPDDCNLLQAENWKITNKISHKMAGAVWREGNVVIDRKNEEIVNIIRFEPPEGGTAAILHVGSQGNKLYFDPDRDIINFPGGSKKFTIRYDSETKKYWSLTNPVLDEYKGYDPERTRNVLALIKSSDLRHWSMVTVILEHPEVKHHGFQYIDWRFEREDIVFVSRTAYDDGLGGAHNCHDANFLTFHRIKDFRSIYRV
ncbi:MAG: exo-alpha-sialidase, partial [Halanaerobiales bacterium]